MRLSYVYRLLVIVLALAVVPTDMWGQQRRSSKMKTVSKQYRSSGYSVTPYLSSDNYNVSSAAGGSGLRMRIEAGVGRSGRDLEFDNFVVAPTFSLAYSINEFMDLGLGAGLYHDPANTGLGFVTSRIYLVKNTYSRVRPYADLKIGYGFGTGAGNYDSELYIESTFSGDKYIYGTGYKKIDGEYTNAVEIEGVAVSEHTAKRKSETAHQGMMGMAGLGFEFRNGFYIGVNYALVTGTNKTTTRKTWEMQDGSVYIGTPVQSSTVAPSNGFLVHLGWNIWLKRK